MKTKTSPIAGWILALLCGTALTLPINVAAEIQPVDKAPSKTLLLPYFEADLNKGTPYDIDNNKGVDKAAPQTPTPPPKKGKKHRNKTAGALDQKTTESTAQSRYPVGFDAVTPPTDPPQGKGKKHRNKNSEVATDKTDAAPKNHDNVLWGDYSQAPPNPPPKSTKSNPVGKNSEGTGTFYDRYQKNDEHQNKQHRPKHGQASSTDTDDQSKKQKKKHHRHGDEQKQGND